MTALLVNGRSILLAGRLGSGKSYIVSDIERRLRARGTTTIAIHGVEHVEQDIAAAITAAAPHRPILLIDDVQALSPTTAAAVVRAVYADQATALLALSLDDDTAAADTVRLTTDLWLHGVADRVDLEGLRAEDAEPLLDQFAPEGFDAATRSHVIALADSSRLLLRELANEAQSAVRRHRDPIATIREPPRHSRLGVALAAHLAQLTDEERLAIALIGSTPGIGYTDAIRFIAPGVLDALIADDLVFDDSTPARLLTANAALARVAADEVGAARIDERLAPVAAHMLRGTGAWWSDAIACRQAMAWHTGRTAYPAFEDVSDDLRERVCLTAARHAIDTGDAGLADAYAALGRSSRTTDALRLESCFAQAMQDNDMPLIGFLRDVDLATLDPGTLMRCVGASLAFPSSISAEDVRRILDAGDAHIDATHPAAAVFDVVRAQIAATMLRWEDATALAERATRRAGASVGTRMMGSALVGLGMAHLGDWPLAERWFQTATRLSRSAPAVLRLTASCLELIARAEAGAGPDGIHQRIAEEQTLAVRDGQLMALAIASISAAISAALSSDAPGAARELAIAGARARHVALGPSMVAARLIAARALALIGGAQWARAVIDSVDPEPITTATMVEYERWMAVSAVLLAERRVDGAATACRAAIAALGGTHSPTLLLRALSQLATIDDDPDVRRGARDLARRLHLPIAARMLEVLNAEEAPVDTVDQVRRMSPWCTDTILRGRHPRMAATDMDPDGAFDAVSTHDLTRREREIAALVDEGLTNRDIAARLFLSVRTVESHIYQARGKVGARSRGELGRLVGVSGRRSDGEGHPTDEGQPS